MSISCVLSVSWSKSFVGVRCSLLMNCSDERDCDHSDGSNFLSVFYLYIWFWRNIGISWKFRMQEEVSISWWPYSISSHSDSRIPVDKQCSLAWSVILLGHPYMSSDDPNLFEHLLVSQIWNFFKEFLWGAFPLVRLKEILPKTLFNKISVVGRLLSPNPMEWQLSVIHFPNTVVFFIYFYVVKSIKTLSWWILWIWFISIRNIQVVKRHCNTLWYISSSISQHSILFLILGEP